MQTRIKNPFKTDAAKRYSHYCYYQYNHLYAPLDSAIPHAVTDQIHRALHDKIVADDYSCVAAQAAFNQEIYRFGVYPQLANQDVTHGLAFDLYNFISESDAAESQFATYIAIFQNPRERTEEEFEACLWQQLQMLHDLDQEHHQWASDISNDPANKQFGFSFAQTGFFIVGMHSNASRMARRFQYPTLVFNMHRQFERLKENDQYQRMQKTIRQREMQTQGSINPMLANFGEISEARQYSGRAVGEGWQCPFHAQHANTNTEDSE